MKRTNGTVRTAAAAALAAAALAWGGAAARAQDAGGAAGETAKDGDLAAEQAYLRGYFAEKELGNAAKAATEYETAMATPGATPDIQAKAALGLLRVARARGDVQRADAMERDLATRFAGVAEVKAELDRAAAARRADGDGTVENAVENAIHQGAPGMVQPYGDRAVPALERTARADAPLAALYAAQGLATIGTPAAREALVRLVASPDLPFPDQVVEGAGLLGQDAFSIARRAASPAVRRRAYERYVSANALDEAARSQVLTDAEARPPVLARLGSEGPVRYLLTALGSSDPSIRGEATAALRSALADASDDDFPGSVSVWRTLPESALEDPDLRALVVDRVLARLPVAKETPMPAPLLRAMASQPSGARWVLRYYTDSNLRTPAPAFDREALRAALANSETQPFGGLARALELTGMTDAEGLRYVASRWHWPQNDFAGSVLLPLTGLRRVDGRLADALLDPGHEPKVLASVLYWLTKTWDQHEVASEASRPVAPLLHHPVRDVRIAAMAALSRFAQAKALDSSIDAAALADALPGVSGNAALTGAIRTLPAASRRTLVPRLDAGDAWVVPLVADLPGEDVDRELEEFALRSASADAVTAAVVALGGRLGERAGPALERILRSVPPQAQSALVSTVAGWRDPKYAGVVERLLLVRFDAAPGIGNGPVDAVTWLPIDAQRRVARAALGSKSEWDRTWGAQLAAVLRDPDAWDDLLAVAEDPDPQARQAARAALRAIEASRRELEEFRSTTEERKVRDRLRALLASEQPAQRRAGVAAVVALGSRDWIGELVRIASEDPSPEVRTAACDALVAFGASAPAAPPPK